MSSLGTMSTRKSYVSVREIATDMSDLCRVFLLDLVGGRGGVK